MVLSIISIVLSSLTSIIAIVVPLRSLKLQQKHDMKKIKVQEFYKSKLITLEELMTAYGNFILKVNEETLTKLSIALNKGMLVCSKIIRNSFQKASYFLENNLFKELKDYFNDHLLEGLGDEIAESRREISN